MRLEGSIKNQNLGVKWLHQMLTEIVNFVATDIEDPFVRVCTCMYKYTHIFIVFPLFLVKISMIFNCTLNGRIYIYLLLFNFC